jgi:hypothetical protein
MPGTPDELTEQQQAPDPVRPRESDSVDANLKERMERLPPGHPSSPYNGDGSRKPSAPDPFQNDSPIPGDPDYRPDTPSTPEADPPRDDSSEEANGHQHSVDKGVVAEKPTPRSEVERPSGEEDKPRIGPDGSWEWKGHPLSPDRSQFADRSLEKCREVEGRDQNGGYGQDGLTPTMRRIEAELAHGKLAPETEKFALKSVDRFKEKLAKLTERYPGENPEKLVTEIHDGIRYTFLFDTIDYVTGVWEATEKLQSQDYELVVQINSWDEAEYKGINTRWREPDNGLLFEVQLHTSESWEAKQRTHDAYEKINDPRTSLVEVERLRQYQREASSQVPQPSGWQSIPNYRKEGKPDYRKEDK